MFVGRGGGGGGVCVELGDWASEKLSRGVQLESYSPKLRVLRKFSFQPYYRLNQHTVVPIFIAAY